jgi:hypothetical protein
MGRTILQKEGVKAEATIKIKTTGIEKEIKTQKVKVKVKAKAQEQKVKAN